MTNLWDTHMHTSFSGDSKTPPEEQLRSAIEKGLTGVCITDHMDLDFPPVPENPELTGDFFLFDPKKYFPAIRALAEKYRDRLTVLTGIELGLQTQAVEKNRAVIAEGGYDFVIGSIHVVDGCDPYYASWWERFPDAKQAIRHYFEVTLENIRDFYAFDALGHLDYVVRYAKDPFYRYRWEDFEDVLEAILSLLIKKGIALELNTGAFRAGLHHPNPDEGILKLYRSLGGELVTVGADAHNPLHVGLAFDRVPGILRECGFTHYAVYKKRKPEFLPLP